MLTVCGTFSPHLPRYPAGTRVSMKGNIVPTLVRERAGPARFYDFGELEGELSAIASPATGGTLLSACLPLDT
jgi:hypothetical protein